MDERRKTYLMRRFVFEMLQVQEGLAPFTADIFPDELVEELGDLLTGEERQRFADDPVSEVVREYVCSLSFEKKLDVLSFFLSDRDGRLFADLVEGN